MLALDQGGPKNVVDAAVQNRHGRRLGTLDVHDSGHVRARRSHQETARLQDHFHVAEFAVHVPSAAQLVQAPAEMLEIERRLAVGVGDAEAAAGVHNPQPRARLSGHLPPDLHEIRDVADELFGVAQVGRAEGVDAQQLHVRRGGRGPGSPHQRLERHPELALDAADEAHRFQARVLGHG